MAPKHTLLALTLALPALSNPQKPEDIATYLLDNAQVSRYQSRIATYDASLTKEPKFSSVMSVAETAFPKDVDWNTVNAPGKTMTTETWYTALPADVKSWWSSVASKERDFVTNTIDDPAPTGAPPAGAAGGKQNSAAASSASAAGASAGSSAGASAGASAGSSAASSASASAASKTSSGASSSASQTGQKAADGTKASGAEEVGGNVRLAQGMAVGVAAAIGAVALLL